MVDFRIAQLPIYRWTDGVGLFIRLLYNIFVKIQAITLFPKMFDEVLGSLCYGRRKRGNKVEYHTINLRFRIRPSPAS